MTRKSTCYASPGEADGANQFCACPCTALRSTQGGCSARGLSQRALTPPADVKADGAGVAARRDVGSVYETSSAHAAMHRGNSAGVDAHCPRCCFVKNRCTFQRACRYGADSSGKLCWLDERPAFSGGTWALGCALCRWHAALKREKKTNTSTAARGPAKKASNKGAARVVGGRRAVAAKPKRDHRQLPRANKWLCFTWRPEANIRVKGTLKRDMLLYMKAHSITDGHRDALEAWRRRQKCVEPGASFSETAPSSDNRGRQAPSAEEPQDAAQASPRCDLKEDSQPSRESGAAAHASPLHPRRPEATAPNVPRGVQRLADTWSTAAVGVESSQENARDSIWRGRVPQLEEWRDAWADTSSFMAFRKQEKIATKKQSQQAASLRKRRRKMLAVQAELVRRRIRKTLRHASSITLALRATTSDMSR